ncbi:type I toxin-antitoxin system Ibs family toxin, partial [Escherichia coli]|nr:type I toxin-antitoxin system Ibs family toxin [Escherichia coli]
MMKHVIILVILLVIS